jgi:beta-xylosidase
MKETVSTKLPGGLPAPIVGERVRWKEPLVRHIFTADPSAHVFDGRVYIYPSHDLDEVREPKDDGEHFDMTDYRILSLANFDSPVLDHGEALHIKDVPWASRQMWAPDAAYKNSKYYLFFPAKDHSGVFRIGVATSAHPAGPFTAEPQPIEGSYSIDPCSFIDDDGQGYLYFGGIWGGQLQRWPGGKYDAKAAVEPTSGEAIRPRVGRLTDDLLGFREPPRELMIVDGAGKPLQAVDKDARYFEGPWMHKYQGRYYFSYSTGDTHRLVYATADNPLGPFTYQGCLLTPVVGWTTHHSTVCVDGQWYLFYHDSTLSGGDTARRCVKVMPFSHAADGSISTLSP